MLAAQILSLHPEGVRLLRSMPGSWKSGKERAEQKQRTAATNESMKLLQLGTAAKIIGLKRHRRKYKPL